VSLAALVLGACTSDPEPEPEPDPDFPDVVDVVHERVSGEYTFTVTLSSPYDSPERYADAFRIVGPDGTEYGVRELAHHHADEQPFTRRLDGVAIPDDVVLVIVEGRDSANGWGGETVEVELE
jgi:hypothetical protein